MTAAGREENLMMRCDDSAASLQRIWPLMQSKGKCSERQLSRNDDGRPAGRTRSLGD